MHYIDLKYKIAVFLALVAVILIMPFQTVVYATDHESSAQSIFEHWEQNGYPDDIGGVYYDQEVGALSVLAIDPSPERIEELRALLGNDVIITRSQSRYSYNEILSIYEEIVATIGVGADSKVYRIAVSRTDADGIMNVLDDSRNEFRVIVNVDESEFARYNAELAEMYGDMVAVMIGSPLYTYHLDTGFRASSFWIIAAVFCIVLFSTFLVLLRQRRRLCFSVKTKKEVEQ